MKQYRFDEALVPEVKTLVLYEWYEASSIERLIHEKRVGGFHEKNDFTDFTEHSPQMANFLPSRLMRLLQDWQFTRFELACSFQTPQSRLCSINLRDSRTPSKVIIKKALYPT